MSKIENMALTHKYQKTALFCLHTLSLPITFSAIINRSVLVVDDFQIQSLEKFDYG